MGKRQKYFKDDAKLIADMLRDQWSLEDVNTPNIEYKVEQFGVNARLGNIFVYPISRNNQISSVDYHNLQRTSNLGIKISNRFRETHQDWCEEVYRILYANRRRGEKCLNGWLFIEILSDRQTGDLSGWYTTTLDIRLTTYAAPIDSSGFGDTINRELDNQTITE